MSHDAGALSGAADLHIHTTHSDGTAGVHQVLAHVRNHTDLRLIAITDHDCIAGSKHAARVAQDYGIEVIVGEEISTRHGHLLALFTERHIAAQQSASETVTAIHAQGGLAIAPHPFDASVPSLGHSELALVLNELGLDGIEGFNGGVIWPLRKCNALAQRVGALWKLPLVGGSDSHSLGTIGKGRTKFEGATARDLYRAIKSNRVTFSGRYWSPGDYIAILFNAVHRHGFLATVRWALQNTGQPARSAVSRKPGCAVSPS